MAAVATEKSAEEVRREIEEWNRQQCEVRGFSYLSLAHHPLGIRASDVCLLFSRDSSFSFVCRSLDIFSSWSMKISLIAVVASLVLFQPLEFFSGYVDRLFWLH